MTAAPEVDRRPRDEPEPPETYEQLPDLEKIESNARTTIARLRPQYPPEDLRAEIADQFPSLDEATVDALLAEGHQDHAVDDRAPDYGADADADAVPFSAFTGPRPVWQRPLDDRQEPDDDAGRADEPDVARVAERDADEGELEEEIARAPEIVRAQHELLDTLARHDRLDAERDATARRYEDLTQEEQAEIDRAEATYRETTA